MDLSGKVVTCIDNNGRSDLLTIGRSYGVDSDWDIVDNNGNYMRVRDFNGEVKSTLHENVTFDLQEDLSTSTRRVLATNRKFIGRKIEMIKCIRTATGLGLKEAKEITDKFNFECEGTVEVDIPIAVRDADAFRDVFMVIPESQDSLEKIKLMAGDCVLKSEYALAKRLISILEDFNYTC